LIESIDFVFLDFDGVIKDSVEVKSDAFEQLFLPFGKDLARRVRKHHELNGGMSRFDKFPIYLRWAGQSPSQSLITSYSNKFSCLVKQKVIDSEWVLGIIDYLQSNMNRKIFFLVTATPQQEIESIIDNLEIRQYFKEVIGSPTKKEDAIRMLLTDYSIEPEQAVMIGDSSSDYYAALANQVSFILRRTKLNRNLQEKLDCLMIKGFL